MASLTILSKISVLKILIDRFNLSSNDLCLVGSATLAVRGLRENDDLDVCFHPSIADQIATDDYEGTVNATVTRKY